MFNKKMTIAATALAASLVANPANALWFDNGSAQDWETKVSCLSVYGAEGAKTAISCDQSANNEANNRPLMANGCAEDQVALSESRNLTLKEEFKINIASCEVEIDGEAQPTQL